MRVLSLLFLLILFKATSFANNVQLTNLMYVAGTAPNSSYVQFDLSWENSWRITSGPANYDGIYIFLKAKNSTTSWLPLTFNGIGNVLPTGFSVTQFNHQKIGSIIHRSGINNGTGNVNLIGIKLGVNDLPLFNADVKAYALEMVNVPAIGAGAFCVGDSINSNGSDLSFYSITSIPGINYATVDTSNWSHIRTLLNSPIDGYNFKLDGISIKGNDSMAYISYNTFPPFSPYYTYTKYPTGGETWCMKYEITQGAYRDFLNSLTYVQQQLHTYSDPSSPSSTKALVPSGSSYRNEICIVQPSVNAQPATYGCDLNGNGIFDEANDGENIACGWLNRDDINAWLWWAGLSPMTEIQYERITRGNIGFTPILSAYNDFAWGDTSFVTNSYTMSNSGTPNELITNLNTASANAIVGNSFLAFDGPVRNGIFATPASSRVSSGSCIFGIMELTGNVSEACVMFGDAINSDFYDARAFGSGLNQVSNGILNVNGKSPINVELMQRGGGFNSPASRSSISSRGDGPYTIIRTPTGGGRGVINIYMVNN